ncbi:alpha/beta hydrolase [Actinoplanes sp. NPDC026623]|uniref:alpha/beta fold hydrolase n=1 Tax=Actinoplanes sp. NPDC026623 TaxID=3155610 RepID=UPI0033ED4173
MNNSADGMYVVHDGRPDAPPLLLLHGSAGTGGFWKPMVPMLAGHRHVLRVDLPGYGRSAPASSYDVPAQAGRVAAVLDDLGLRHVAVAGHSSGGWAGIALAEQRPDLVGSLTLISTGPSLDSVRPDPLLVRALMAPPLGPLVWPRRTDAMMRRGINSMCARPVVIPDDVLAEMRGLGYGRMRALMRQNVAYLAERSAPERLAALDVPVLVIFGDADPRYRVSMAHRYEQVAGARLELLPGVGHMPIFESPEQTAKLLLGFVAQRT